ncbi:hypothetical protein EA658_16625 [Pseudoxanthomonas winnipegensis]|uniref:Uncharacterized protein n=1 Tax=Pseudoxanthomonas winnipegensis TaxID=2480810 RepID=A0ABY1WCI4_9GAMM|nr:hypothetical protein [Pseudoxanthomonas winnipegensis]TAA11288.1 hypothetical protein EA659_08040 [Pseudoxanthomonas winnipegensis]TAA18711.1 hypothetical protein EA658_16625 [Pseudoxanthomonas winnipegensis]TAH73913.1 hypothetical protein EA657_00120 [Pseudoxanthomonas winnipegensis]
MPRRKDAIAGLESVIRLAETPGARPSPKLLEAIGNKVRDSIELLKEPDPEKQRVGFILLAIKQSTDVRKFLRNGKEVRRVYVTDLDLYTSGMDQLHNLALDS